MQSKPSTNGLSYKRIAGILGAIVFAAISFWMGDMNGRMHKVEILTATLDERTGGMKEKVNIIKTRATSTEIRKKRNYISNFQEKMNIDEYIEEEDDYKPTIIYAELQVQENDYQPSILPVSFWKNRKLQKSYEEEE